MLPDVDIELEEKAIKAWYNYCKRNGVIYQQPSRGSVVVGRKYVYLSNINGDLAKYDFKRRRIVV